MTEVLGFSAFLVSLGVLLYVSRCAATLWEDSARARSARERSEVWKREMELWDHNGRYGAPPEPVPVIVIGVALALYSVFTGVLFRKWNLHNQAVLEENERRGSQFIAALERWKQKGFRGSPPRPPLRLNLD